METALWGSTQDTQGHMDLEKEKPGHTMLRKSIQVKELISRRKWAAEVGARGQLQHTRYMPSNGESLAYTEGHCDGQTNTSERK